MPPLGLAMVPCGPGIGCCATPGRLRVVRKLLAVHCRTLDLDDNSNQHTRFHSFINYFVVMYETRFALNCWLYVCRFPHRWLLMYAFPVLDSALLVVFNGVNVRR